MLAALAGLAIIVLAGGCGVSVTVGTTSSTQSPATSDDPALARILPQKNRPPTGSATAGRVFASSDAE